MNGEGGEFKESRIAEQSKKNKRGVAGHTLGFDPPRTGGSGVSAVSADRRAGGFAPFLKKN